MKKWIALVLVLACSAFPAMAHNARDYYTDYDNEYESIVSENFGDWFYDVQDDGTAMIIDYYGSDEHVVIPEAVDGLPVTALGPSVLYGQSWFHSVEIPKSVTKIEINPFVGCPMLTEIRVAPDHATLQVIDGVLFDKTDHRLICYPSAFTSTGYTVPEGTEIIGKNAFCTIYDGYRTEEADRGLTLGDMTFPWGWLRDVTLPEGLTAIEDGAFAFCGELTHLYVPDSVQFIGDDAFRCDRDLTVLVKPDSYAQAVCRERGIRHALCDSAPALPQAQSAPLEQHGDYHYRVLEDNSAEIVRCTSFGEYAPTEKNVVVPAELDGHPVTAIGKGAFCNALDMTSIVIPEGVTEIGQAAFYECSSLVDVKLPNTLRRIGDGAFIDCFALSHISIPDSVTEIGANPFARCPQLRDIELSSGHASLEVVEGVLFSKPDRRLVTYPDYLEASRYVVPEGTEMIGDLAFYHNRAPGIVHLPDSLKTIGVEAFNWSIAIENMPEGVREIREGAFRQCFALKEITVPEGVTHIADMLFWGSGNLTRITLPDGLISIGEMAFIGCESLTELTIPASVTYIAPDAFGRYNHQVIQVYPDSAALKYCVEEGVPYSVLQDA